MSICVFGIHSEKRCPDCEISLLETADGRYYCPMCEEYKEYQI